MKRNLIGIIIIIIGIVFSFLIIINSHLSSKKIDPGQLKEARFYEVLDNNQVRCNLCPNRCVLSEGQTGLCKVRQNISGKLYSLVYGKPVSVHVDPIEKKPLYHFLPGTKIFSLATAGCNLECKYCQNWDIAQRAPEDLDYTPMSPTEVVENAIASGSKSIAFTYNEPTVWYEYMFDIARLAKAHNLYTVVISAGYISQEPLKELLPYIDAYKIDLKSFNSDTYRELVRGELEPVLDTIKTIKESGTWLELVHLTVPGYTDDMEEISEMCTWVKDNVGEDTPMHFSRFWPKYKLLNLPPTPEEVVKQARLVCLEAGLNYVYTGNIQDIQGSTTFCPTNSEPIITRLGHSIQTNLITASGSSSVCDVTIPGIWQQ